MVNCSKKKTLYDKHQVTYKGGNVPFQQMENQLRLHGHHPTSKHQSLLLSPISLVVQEVVTYTLQAWLLTIQDDIPWLK